MSRQLIPYDCLILLLALLALSGCTRAAAPAPSPTPAPIILTAPPPNQEWLDAMPVQLTPELDFDHLFLEVGLSQSVVAVMAQDPQGFLWLGTQDGLNRFDGYQCKVFKNRRDDPDSLSGNLINALLVVGDGVLWVGSNGGLDRYDPQTESFTRYQYNPDDPTSLSSNSVTELAADPSGVLWVGTSAGLNRFDPATGQAQRYLANPNDPDSLPNQEIGALLLAPDGALWIGTSGGLSRLDTENGRFTHYLPDLANPHSLSGTPVTSLAQDENGTLWIATSAGLNRLDAGADRFRHYRHDPQDPASLSNDLVTAVYHNRRGELWLGTTQGGVNRYDPASDSFVQYRHDPASPHSLANDNVVSLLEDAAGIMWFGTFGSGADRFDRMKAKFLRVQPNLDDPSDLNDPFIWSILVDSHDTLWLGTFSGGLNRADAGDAGFTHYLNDPADPDSLSSNQVWRVYEDRQGTLWVGTAAGLDRFERENGRFSHYDFGGLGVFSLYESASGDFWVSPIGGGLVRLDRQSGETLAAYTHDPADPQGLNASFVTAISETADGALWLGTFAGGLNLFTPENGRFTHYQYIPDDPDSLPNDTILALHQDRLGQLWIGTAGGLARFDSASERFITYGEPEGLPNETIYALLADDQGYLWISTSLGLSRFDPQQETFQNFDLGDGLQAMEFNQGAAFKGAAGEMYFGGINGFNFFHPAAIRANPYVPPVVVTNFLLFNKEVGIGEESPLAEAPPVAQTIELDYQQDFLTFEYAALHFSAPQENQYAYLLEGFDEEWNQVGTRRFANYPGLPPGDYTFRVHAANSDGVWNEQGTAVRVIMTPPFWQTWWFMALAVGVVVGGVVGGFVLRIRVIEGQRRQLARLVDERTLALQETLAALQGAKTATDAANERYERELALAALVQSSFLTDQFPELVGWQIAARLQPAREMSGDFFDVLRLPNGRLGLMMADVVDKGVPAALLMAISWGLLEPFAQQYPDEPESVLCAINERLLYFLEGDYFVTAFYGVLEPENGRLRYCNAGHPPVLLLRADNGRVRELCCTGIPLGLLEESRWQTAEVTLAPGDILLLYTDGVMDAEAADGSYMGRERLQTAVQSAAGGSAQEICTAVETAVARHTGDVPQLDDMALLALRRIT
ncbi:MAG: two-component regulator propeller domain-containing protein [Chloroflexota bacterium]